MGGKRRRKKESPKNPDELPLGRFVEDGEGLVLTNEPVPGRSKHQRFSFSKKRPT